jgi:hypothetical protein
MLYATFSDTSSDVSGHVGEESLTRNLNYNCRKVMEIQADGDELAKCCDLLGRKLPSRRVYTFLGINAMEIAMNWDSN